MSKARKDNWLESEDFLSDIDQILELVKNDQIKREIDGWEGYEDLYDHLNARGVCEYGIQVIQDLITECQELRKTNQTKKLMSILT
jgi:hypothetical protein